MFRAKFEESNSVDIDMPPFVKPHLAPWHEMQCLMILLHAKIPREVTVLIGEYLDALREPDGVLLVSGTEIWMHKEGTDQVSWKHVADLETTEDMENHPMSVATYPGGVAVLFELCPDEDNDDNQFEIQVLDRFCHHKRTFEVPPEFPPWELLWKNGRLYVICQRGPMCYIDIGFGDPADLAAAQLKRGQMGPVDFASGLIDGRFITFQGPDIIIWDPATLATTRVSPPPLDCCFWCNSAVALPGGKLLVILEMCETGVNVGNGRNGSAHSILYSDGTWSGLRTLPDHGYVLALAGSSTAVLTNEGEGFMLYDSASNSWREAETTWEFKPDHFRVCTPVCLATVYK